MMHLKLLLTLAFLVTFARAAAPLAGIHAHNDYEHARPLFDALDQGYCSVEADIYLVEGRLLVAHEARQTKPERTLEALYLDPLRERIRANGGRVQPTAAAFTLLIDVKTEAVATYAALHAVLERYAPLLTTYRGDAVSPGAITVILSGNRARAQITAQAIRYVAIDGRPEDLDGTAPATLVPWISANWNVVFKWRWSGPMPAEVRAELAKFAARVHAQGRVLRFWNTPDRAEAWQELRAAGVDIIGTDDLPGLAAFVRR